MSLDDKVDFIVEKQQLLDRIQDLLSANTRLVDERRAIDREAMLQTAHRNVFDQPVRHVPVVPSDDEVRLRARLVSEEFQEKLRAMFAESTVEPWHFERLRRELEYIIENCKVEVDLVELADGNADLKVILEGTDVTFGIPSHEIFAEVHRTNMEKANGPKRADGKRQKPVGWKPPDIEGILRRHGWTGTRPKKRGAP